MEQVTCIQFEEASSEFNPELCLYLDNGTLIYAEGAFLLIELIDNSDSAVPTIEFSASILQIHKVVCKTDQFLLILLADDTISIIDLKNFKTLNTFSMTFLPGKIKKIRQSRKSQHLYLFTSTNSLFLIENFILFTRLTPELLKERYEGGQILKEFSMSSKVNDFIVIENDEDKNLIILTVGEDHMVSWWTIPSESDKSTQQSSSSLMNYFSSAFTKQPAPTDTSKPTVISLNLLKFLHEPDRTIDRILMINGTLALLEDSTHSRLLVLDAEHALILKIFKGYRNCSCTLKGKKLSLWAGNKFILEHWESFPFGQKKSSKEFPDSSAAFDQNGNFFTYNSSSLQLELFKQ